METNCYELHAVDTKQGTPLGLFVIIIKCKERHFTVYVYAQLTTKQQLNNKTKTVLASVIQFTYLLK